MIRFANLLQAPTVSIYQLVKTITFVLYLFDMVEMNKMKMKMKKYSVCEWHLLSLKLTETFQGKSA